MTNYSRVAEKVMGDDLLLVEADIAAEKWAAMESDVRKLFESTWGAPPRRLFRIVWRGYIAVEAAS